MLAKQFKIKKDLKGEFLSILLHTLGNPLTGKGTITADDSTIWADECTIFRASQDF